MYSKTTNQTLLDYALVAGITKYTKQKMGIILVENTWITKINVLLTLMLLCYMSIWCEIDYNHPFTIANDEPFS